MTKLEVAIEVLQKLRDQEKGISWFGNNKPDLKDKYRRLVTYVKQEGESKNLSSDAIQELAIESGAEGQIEFNFSWPDKEENPKEGGQ